MSHKTTIEFFKKFTFMCENQVCSHCELRKRAQEAMSSTGMAYDCKNFLFDHPEIAVPLVEQYYAQNGAVTFLQDVMAKHPDMPLTPSGIPYSCAQNLGYLKSCPPDTDDCVTCWNQLITRLPKEGEQ